MQTRQMRRGDATITINFNSDWSGPVEVVVETAGERRGEIFMGYDLVRGEIRRPPSVLTWMEVIAAVAFAARMHAVTLCISKLEDL